jgi:hypothetical protein
MAEFHDMICRVCGQVIVPRVKSLPKARTATRHADCYYVCANSSCGVAYSNAKTEGQRTKIYLRKEMNIPVEVRDSLDEVLACSMNVTNRATKAAKFAFETSEDAVTWTVIRYLKRTEQICCAFDLPKAEVNSVLLWGSGCHGEQGILVREALEKVLIDVLRENPKAFTEPDVVILLGDWLIFIEVKYHEPNSCKQAYAHFERYLAAGDSFFVADINRIKEDGYEELVRNWVAGWLLATKLKKRFQLVNLTGMGCARSAGRFAESIQQSPERVFRHLSWAALLDRLKQPLEPWFAAYMESKGLLASQPPTS